MQNAAIASTDQTRFAESSESMTPPSRDAGMPEGFPCDLRD